MKKVNLLILILIFAAGLAACTKTGEKVDALPGTASYKIYCLTNEETELVSERYFSPETDTKALLKELILQLDKTPENISYKKAKPDQVEIEDFSLMAGGKVTLYFNIDYTKITGLSEVLMRAAVVKTLCQVPDVDSIEFYVGGQPLMETPDKAVGFMRGDDIIDNTGNETNFYQYADLTLYFSTGDGQGLTIVPVSIRYDGTIALEQLVLEQLIAGPEKISGINTNLVRAAVPGNTILNAVSVADGICYMDLSQEFLTPMEGISPQVSIYSLVNSLVELPNIDKVQIVIDGQEVEKYQDAVEMNQMFESNLDLIK